MKTKPKLLSLTLMTFACMPTIHAQDYPYKDVPFTAVHFSDTYLAPRIEATRTTTVPYAFRKCEETGRIANFEVAAKRRDGKFQTGSPFDDSDVFKIVEGAAYLLAVQNDEKLDKYVDDLAQLFSEAQEPDGYLYTNRTINNPPHPWIGTKRWEMDWDLSHETYNMGHFFEAAAAHYLATGKHNMLDIAIKAANLMYKDYYEGKLCIAPGHQVVEMGLVRLYRVTGDKRYLNLAHYFLETRGKDERFDPTSDELRKNGQYWQNHIPVSQQREAVGHAVRATYQYCGMADIAALKNDKKYLKAIDAIWSDIVEKKYYITGGIGALHNNEAFGPAYYLPNRSAYCETCASISNCMFNHRMFMLHGDAKYIDVLERSLYNAALSGINLNGDRFFYPNPLEVGDAGQDRSEWFGCSCCPSNLARFIPSLPGYQYATHKASLYVNLFVEGTAEVDVNKKKVALNMQTNYPWDGNISLTVNPKNEAKFALHIRIPGWYTNQPVPSDLYHYSFNMRVDPITFRVNDIPVKYKTEKGYAIIERAWKAGDKVEFNIPMKPLLVEANNKVEDDRGMVAIECGPLVYCAEQVDNEKPLAETTIPPYVKLRFVQSYDKNMLQGTNVLACSAEHNTLAEDGTLQSSPCNLRMIPYALRSHRDACAMQVWMAQDKELVRKACKRSLVGQNAVDQVLIGNKKSETAHNLQGVNTGSGPSEGGNWRHAGSGGWFSYDMKVLPNEPMQLVLNWWTDDHGARHFKVLIDGTQIADPSIRYIGSNDYIDYFFPIPEELTKGKEKVTVRLEPFEGNTAGGIFDCRIEKTKK